MTSAFICCQTLLRTASERFIYLMSEAKLIFNAAGKRAISYHGGQIDHSYALWVSTRLSFTRKSNCASRLYCLRRESTDYAAGSDTIAPNDAHVGAHEAYSDMEDRAPRDFRELASSLIIEVGQANNINFCFIC